MEAERRAPVHVALSIAMRTPDDAGTRADTGMDMRATTTAPLASRAPA